MIVDAASQAQLLRGVTVLQDRSQLTVTSAANTGERRLIPGLAATAANTDPRATSPSPASPTWRSNSDCCCFKTLIMG